MTSRHEFLDIGINALTAPELLELISTSIFANQRCLIGHHNLHSLYLFHHDPQMRAFYQQTQYTYADGMAVVWLGRLLSQPLRAQHRMTCVDYVHPLMRRAASERWSIFYLGSDPANLHKTLSLLRSRLPKLRIHGRSGFFDVDGEENSAVIREVNSFSPDLLMVGMGMPRQEHWMLRNWTDLHATVGITVGACFDYLAGGKATAPRWMARLGFEWLFRLATEPRRLWTRYLVEPWFILKLMVDGRAGGRRGHFH